MHPVLCIPVEVDRLTFDVCPRLTLANLGRLLPAELGNLRFAATKVRRISGLDCEHPLVRNSKSRDRDPNLLEPFKYYICTSARFKIPLQKPGIFKIPTRDGPVPLHKSRI